MLQRRPPGSSQLSPRSGGQLRGKEFLLERRRRGEIWQQSLGAAATPPGPGMSSPGATTSQAREVDGGLPAAVSAVLGAKHTAVAAAKTVSSVMAVAVAEAVAMAVAVAEAVAMAEVVALAGAVALAEAVAMAEVVALAGAVAMVEAEAVAVAMAEAVAVAMAEVMEEVVTQVATLAVAMAAADGEMFAKEQKLLTNLLIG
jgi:hypothetical protein